MPDKLQLLGVASQAVHAWHLAMHADAVEWVRLPNTLGMSQHADGGPMAGKPYVARGKYIQRMRDYCAGCRQDPAPRTGPAACPFTTLNWAFLLRHERRLARLTPADRLAIRGQSRRMRDKCLSQ